MSWLFLVCFHFYVHVFLRASRHIKSYQSSCCIAKHGFVIACVFLMYFPCIFAVAHRSDGGRNDRVGERKHADNKTFHYSWKFMDWNQYTYLHQPYGKTWYNSSFWAEEGSFKPNLSHFFHFHGYRNDISLHLMQLLEPCCPHALPRWYAPTVGNARHISPAKQLQKRMQLALLVTVCGSSIRDLVCIRVGGRINKYETEICFLFCLFLPTTKM